MISNLKIPKNLQQIIHQSGGVFYVMVHPLKGVLG